MDYSYQPKIATKVLVDALSGEYRAAVLAACPGAGKTTISQIIINSYIALYPDAKVLVLTEGQNTLKNQYLEELESANIPINFTFGELESDAQVRVGLPQSIGNLKWGSVDLLVVDEAHRFWNGSLHAKIAVDLTPKHKVLLTGSPTEFNLYNKNNFTSLYAMHYIAAEDLEENGVFNAVAMDVAKVADKKNPTRAIGAVMVAAAKNDDDTSKVMVACPTIEYANQVADQMRYMGRKVSISTSKNDKDSDEIKAFKAGDTDVLVVVGRGTLGFNDKNVTMIADLRSSSDVDVSYQLFARVLRKHPVGIRKSYWRIADKDYKKQVFMLHKMYALMRRDIYKGFTGKNLKLEVECGLL